MRKTTTIHWLMFANREIHYCRSCHQERSISPPHRPLKGVYMTSLQSTQALEPEVGPHSGECCVEPGMPIKGTYFLGGAGMNGYYIEPLVRELRSAGIGSAVFLDKQKWSAGTGMDAAVGSVFGRLYDPRFPMRLRHSDRPLQTKAEKSSLSSCTRLD